MMRKMLIVLLLTLSFTCLLLAGCSEPTTYYQIGFETNGGEQIENLLLEQGSEINLPTPTKDGMVFAGWYIDGKLQNKFDSSGKMPAKSFWLYANWKVELKFDSMGGDDVASIVGKPRGFIEDIPTPVYGDYVFQGWYFDKQYTQKLTMLMPETSATVYARWQAVESTTCIDITDTIALNGSGFYTLEKEPDGYKVTATPNKGAWDYFYFTLDYNVKEYSIFEIVLEGKKDTKYMTKLESGTTGGATNIEVQRVLIGQEETIYWQVSSANLTATGGQMFIIFLNFNVAGCDVAEPEWIKIKSIKLFRTMDVGVTEKHSLFFDTDGGSIVEPIFAELGQKIEQPSAPTKPGYQFDGWYSDEACTAPFEFDTMPQGPTTVHAKWIKNTPITISFNTNGAGEIESISTTVGSVVGTLPTLKLDDKFFIGWYEDAQFTQKFTATTYSKSMTLHALFINPETDLANPVSLLEGWSDRDQNCYDIVSSEKELSITTTANKGTWSLVEAIVPQTDVNHCILKITYKGTAGQKVIVKFNDDFQLEFQLTLSEQEQTYYFMFTKEIDFSKPAFIFIDGGIAGSTVSGTNLVITEMALYEPSVGSESN